MPGAQGVGKDRVIYFDRMFEVQNPRPERDTQRPETRERSSVKAQLEKILHRQAAPEELGHQLQALESMTELDIAHAVNEAINFIAVHGRFDQFHLGGDFVSADGKPNRGRRVITLDEPTLMARYPFLRHLCLKIVPPETRLQDEVAIQRGIQEKLAAQPYNPLQIPLVLGEIQRPDIQLKAAVFERLPRNKHSGSLQTLISNAKEDHVALRLSNDIEADITRQFQALHALGYEHRDINDGNVYLTNAEWEDISLPKEPGKIRPSRIRLLTKATVYILDFERTHALPSTQPETAKGLVEQENSHVRRMVDPFCLEVDAHAELDDVIQANDDYYRRLNQSRAAA